MNDCYDQVAWKSLDFCLTSEPEMYGMCVVVGHNRELLLDTTVLLLVPPGNFSRQTQHIVKEQQLSFKTNSTFVSGISWHPDMKMSISRHECICLSNTNPSFFRDSFEHPSSQICIRYLVCMYFRHLRKVSWQFMVE